MISVSRFVHFACFGHFISVVSFQSFHWFHFGCFVSSFWVLVHALRHLHQRAAEHTKESSFNGKHFSNKLCIVPKDLILDIKFFHSQKMHE